MSDIVFLTTECEPFTRGGAGVVVRRLADELAVEHAVRVIVVGVESTESRGEDVSVEFVPALPPDAEASTPFLAASRAGAMALAQAVQARRPDLVEVQDFDGLAWWTLMHRPLLGLTDIPIQVRFHGTADLQTEAMAVVPPDLAHVVTMEGSALAAADRIVAPSDAMAAAIAERYGVPINRVAVSRPFVPDPGFRVHYPTADAPHVVCYGRMSEVKGTHDFAQAAALLLDEFPDLTVSFVGEDGWSATTQQPMSDLVRSIIPERLWTRVIFRDRVARTDATVWDGATLAVLPSRFEAFSLAARELRMVGIPIVIPDLPAWEGDLTEATGAAVYRSGELTALLRSLLGDRARLVRLAHTSYDPNAEGSARRMAPYLDLPTPRHPQAQAGLATEATQRLERLVVEPATDSTTSRLARAALAVLPRPVAGLAVRVLPAAVKDRFRRVADWNAEAARRAALDRRTRFSTISSLAAAERPGVSVVIPCFNQGEFVLDAIMSVFEQDFESWEIIVVDDGSTDPATIAVLDGMAYPRVRLIRQRNGGLPAARNTGMRAAVGTFLVPLDADDELGAGFLTQMVAALSARPDAAFAHCWAELFGDVEQVWATRPFDRYAELYSNSVVGCVLLRRDAWEAVGGYDETLLAGNEDWELWVRLTKLGWGQVQVLAPLFRYRKHGISMSVSTEAAFEQGLAELRDRHPDLYEGPTNAEWRAGSDPQGASAPRELLGLPVVAQSWEGASR